MPFGAVRGLQWLQHAGAPAVAPGLWSTGSGVVVPSRAASRLVGGVFPGQGSHPCSLHCKVAS